jgi:hypothetical protein
MLKRYGAAIVGSLAGGSTFAHDGDPMTSLGIGAATTTGLGAMNAIAQASRAATATRVPVLRPGLLRGGLSWRQAVHKDLFFSFSPLRAFIGPTRAIFAAP